MSLEAQYRAVYALMYKRSARQALARGEQPTGLTDAEAREVKAAAGERQAVVVALHANDIGVNWYLPRVPATWAALQAALDCDQAELTMRFADSEAFELRVNDDADCRALAAWVEDLTAPAAPWLADLLRYERHLAGLLPTPQNPRVESFGWDVAGIREALLEQGLFPADERPRRVSILMSTDADGVSEAALTREQAGIVQALLDGNQPQGKAAAIKHCRRLLAQVSA